MRRSAKALNFGVIYGMSVYGFAESAGIEREDAKKFIDEYMAKFSGIAEYMRKTKEATKINLYVETEMGRRRYLPEINSSNFQVQNAAERMAINMPIQGLAADIMKLAMIKVAEFIEEYNRRGPTPIDQNSSKKSDLDKDVRMLLQVHDEIILEAREDLAEEVAKKVKENMENAYALSVPLVVDVKVGDSWGEI
jgi:DNA polymerase-1